ncbi:MAG: murein biosynthesis integral membrane protein MurJ [Sedimentisphaerales bacterium]|nr:murein biosynthesis integral membrane protein MurJ [Sedimentisphaerales bacterium]
MNDKARQEHQEREHFFNAAKVVAGITVISRIFGLFRDMGITSLGANRSTDAFGLAFQIPNLFRRLFGEGALASAFVPVFSETAEKSGFEKASKLFANALALLAVFLVTVMLLVEIGFFTFAMLPGPQDRKLLMTLATIMFPYMVTVCLLALGSATLNCRGHFAFPAAAPIIFNIAGIIAAWWVAPLLKGNIAGQLEIVAVSVVAAGVIQLIAVLWLLNKSGFSIRPRLRPIEPGIIPILKMLAPVLLGLGFLQISDLFQNIISWNLTATQAAPDINIFGWILHRPLTPGVITRVGAARALYQFPMGVLAISLGVAVFPLLTRYAARKDMVNLKDSINRALRLALMEGIASGVGLYILAVPIVKVIFARRNFSPQDAAQAAFVLQMYVIGMWSYCSYQILARSFYSLKDTITPLKVSCSLAILNLIMLVTLVWIPSLGAGAFGLSTTITFGLNACVLIYLLRRRLGLMGGRKITVSVVRSIIASAIMAGIIYVIRWYMSESADWVIVVICVPVGIIVFFCVAYLLGAPEIAELFKRTRGDAEGTPSADVVEKPYTGQGNNQT